MRTTKVLHLLAVPIVAFLAIGSHCPLIPEVEERLVELAVLGSTTVEFTSQGELNVIDQTRTINVRDDFDLEVLLDNAGIDVSKVTDIALAGVSYRTTRPELGVARRIENGTVTIQRGAGPVTPLVTSFSEFVNDILTYKTAPLDPAGVAVLNSLMDDLLAELQGGPVANADITYHLSGNSVPGLEETDFDWEIKVDVSIVGEIEVDVVD